MSRYFYHKPEPVDEEIKNWLAQNFDLAEIRQSHTRFRTVKDKIVPRFQQYIQQLKAEHKNKLIENGFITSSNIVTTQGIIYLLYLTSSSSFE